MEGLKDIMTLLEAKANKNYIAMPTDYEKDGEVYCGICHTRKKGFAPDPFDKSRKELKVFACDCIEAKEKQAEMKKRTEELRRICFSDIALYCDSFDKDDGKSSDIIESAKKYVKYFDEYSKRGVGVLFMGGVGNGKTFAVACILNALIDKGKRCKMTSFPSISRQWSDFAKRDDIVNELKTFDVIAIDDFGAERKSESSNEMVYSIIDALLKAKKPVIYTTNIPLEEILGNPNDVTTQRIYSRLYEMCIPIECKGQDRRATKMMDLKKEFDSKS